MEVYVLDNLLRREVVLDRFESLIWTERYYAAGDFEFHINADNLSQSLLTPGTWLAINESYRVMEVQTIVNKEDSSGQQTLIVTGESIETILRSRVAAGNLSSATSDHTWALSGVPMVVAQKIFDDICRTGKLSQNDIIPFLKPGSIFPAGTLPNPANTLTLTLEPASVYDAIANLCTQYGLGFRLVRNMDNSELYFDIYNGNDLTTGQNNFPAVVFSPGLDNLGQISQLQSSAKLKNVAYVISPAGVEIVYAPGVDSTVSGFEKRILLVDATDLTAIGSTSNTLMIQRGLDALNQQTNIYALDGTITQLNKYRLGIDYNLGDIIEIRDDQGLSNNMRVTEHIYASDGQGDRSYPTLVIDQFVTPGSWESADFNATWDSLNSTATWDSGSLNS